MIKIIFIGFVFVLNIIFIFCIYKYIIEFIKTKRKKIKLFLSDIDGTLTDGSIYYSEKGEELKQFSHKDGRGFHLLHKLGIKCVLITSESEGINKARFEKFNRLGTVKDYIDNVYGKGKLNKVINICKKYNINSDEIAYIGDDTNDNAALVLAGYKACPADANYLVKKIKGIKVMKAKGGQGAVREFIDWLIKKGFV